MAGSKLKERPKVAFILMLSGGLFILLGSISSFLLSTLFRSLITQMITHMYGYGFYGFSLAAIGMLFGIVVVYSAFMVDSLDVEKVRKWSTIGLICSVLSLLDFGGFFLGFVLSFVGSIMAMMAK
ncbi:MAG: hypothetical protein KGI00_04170 [Candidatus Micrarchaeota archaeon]|nr:hypothetical protein [Candidatus Micrarchaeota archaeon]MDE1849896.1 hypothetical protein [Candidatus Micrarchaeota archaeon]